MPGSLAREPRSDNGFEDDPILLVEGDSRTSAELTFQEKNVICNRGKTFRALAGDLRKIFIDSWPRSPQTRNGHVRPGG
jgi:XTP/dITP diphosphohydrolase